MQNIKGPLFVVGMPRSGTKLLRDLLNRHSEISIPEVETHFFPLFIKKYGIKLNFTDENKRRLIEDFLNTSFYWNEQQQGVIISGEFDNKLRCITNWEEFIFLILSYFGPKKDNENILYGDKTPGYINHLDLLKLICPQAKFIHIIRDPRDFCLSVKNIWNKHLLRAAYMWNNTLEKAFHFRETFKNDYTEVKYEDLISDAETSIKNLCCFLNLGFEPAMCTLSKPAENYGDAKGITEIVSNNKNKFLSRLSKKDIMNIELFTFQQMDRLGYKSMYATKTKKPSNINLSLWKLYDAYNSIRFHTREKGLMNGINYFRQLHRQSSWR
jgi:hypothetical protein